MDLNHGKYLGVDYGDRRTGLAESDASGLIATRAGILTEGGMKKTAIKVAEIARERGIKKIIVGLPKNMDGTEGNRAEVIRAFVALLAEECDIPIELYDERMTTMIAYRLMDTTGTFGERRRGVVDALAAEVILQNYLDWERNNAARTDG